MFSVDRTASGDIQGYQTINPSDFNPNTKAAQGEFSIEPTSRTLQEGLAGEKGQPANSLLSSPNNTNELREQNAETPQRSVFKDTNIEKFRTLQIDQDYQSSQPDVNQRNTTMQLGEVTDRSSITNQ